MKVSFEILDVAGLADLLKIDPQTVSRKAQRGEIPGFKIGNRWRFRLSDIHDWIGQKVESRNTPSLSSVVQKIKRYFEDRNKFDLVYLFGSQARGEANSKSDVDIGVLLKQGIVADVDLQSQISSDLMKSLNVLRVDVVFINLATPLLKYEIVNEGKVVYRDPDFDLISYKLMVVREFQDTEYLRKVGYDYLLDASNF